MSELDELLGTGQAQGTNPFKPDEKQYMKGKIAFRAILTVTIYPNGMMAAHISRPLSPSQQFAPRKKMVKKSSLKFEGVKKSSIDLG